MSRMWGGRFTGVPDPLFDRFQRSLGFDRRLADRDLEASLAWAAALERAGVLRADERAALASALEALREELAADPSPLERSHAEDVHGFVEAALVERVGELGKKLHAGRSRNDQVATDLKLWLRGRAADLRAAARGLIGALVALADEHAELPLPGYTHLQRAQPVTVGHHALAYVEMLARDLGRIDDALARMDTCPLGSGALAGTGFPIDREALASDLGFAGGATRNSLDAVSDRDHAIELASACSLAMVHLSRLAEDWIFLAGHETGLLALSDAVTTGSSLMPQKRNPDALELVRGKAARVIGDLSSLLVLMKGLPLAYDRDLQEDKELLFDCLDTTIDCLAVTRLVVENARFDAERCTAAASSGHMNATDLADLLVERGVAFRDAHERVGRAVATACELGCELDRLPRDTVRELFPELDVDLAAALALPAVLARHRAIGGTAPERVRAEVARWKERSAAWS